VRFRACVTTMAYTNLDITLRVVALYLTLLVIASIYQAISPTSPHNRGEIVDHGAQLLQDAFKDLRIHYPRFDYLVQTVNQVLLQTMLMVTMRYDVNTAVNMSLGIGIVLIAIIFVLGRLVVQVITTVFSLVSVLMLHTIWSPFSVLVGIIELFGALVEFFCGFIDRLWEFMQSLGSGFWTHFSSRRHDTLVADDSSPKEDDDKSVADE
jgi:phage-related protein